MAKIIDYISKVDTVETNTHTASLPVSPAVTDQLLIVVVKDSNTGDMTLDAASVTAGWQIAQPDEARRSSRMLIVSAPGNVIIEPIINSTDIDAWGSMSFAIRHGSDITSANIASVNPVGFLNENSSNLAFHQFSGITTTGKNSVVFWVGGTSDDQISPQPGWGTIYGPVPIKNAKNMAACEYVGPSGDARPAPYWHSGDSNTWASLDMDQCVFEIVDVNQVSPLVVPLTSGGPRGDIKKMLELFCYGQSLDSGDPWLDNPTRVTDPTNGDHLPVPVTIDGITVDYIESGTLEFAGLGLNRRRITNGVGFYAEQSGYYFQTPVVPGSMGVQQIDFAWPLGSVDRVTPNTSYSVDFTTTLNKMIMFNVVVRDSSSLNQIGNVDQGGLYFYVVDSLDNWRAWMFDAKNDLRQDASWNRSYVLDPNSTQTMVDESVTPVDVTDIVSCGVGVHAVSPRAYYYLSRFYVVEPWIVSGGNAANPCSIADILEFQKGCFCKPHAVQGTNTLFQGILQIGDGVNATHNVESEVTYECQEIHNTSIPDLGYNVDDAASGLIFDLTANCVVDWTDVIITSRSPQRFEFLSALGSATLDNCFFRHCDIVWLRDGHTYSSCTFDKCLGMYANNPDALGCIFKNSTYIAGALQVDSALSTAMDGLTGAKFIDNDVAVFIHQAGTYTLDDVLFSGNTVDIQNNSAGLVTINMINGTNAVTIINSGGGTTVLVPEPLTLKFVVIDELGAPVADAFTYIDDDDNLPHIMNTTTDINGEASVSYSDGILAGTTWRVRKYGYKPYRATVDIGTENITIPVTLVKAPQQT